jgi:CHAT domain-containing protein
MPQSLDPGRNNELQAAEAYQQILKDAQASKDTYGELDAQQKLGTVYLKNEKYDEAVAHYQSALALAKELQYCQQEARVLIDLGKVAKQQGNISEAINYYKDAIQIAESIRSIFDLVEKAVSFANFWGSYYEELIELLFQDGKESSLREAFTYVERAKSRAFIDQIANGIANRKIDFRKSVDPDLIAQGEALLSKINELHHQLIDLRKPPKNKWDNVKIAEVDKELTTGKNEYEDWLNKLKSQSYEMACLISVDVATLDQIQELLDADTTLVEYFVSAEHTFVFVITRDRFRSLTLLVSREALEKNIADSPYLSNRDNSHPSELKQLHEWLIAPLKSELEPGKIGIVPHAILHYLPFAALTHGDHYLCDDYALFTLPCASLLRFLPKKRSSRTQKLLALGDPEIAEQLPRLRFARKEVEAIASLFSTKALIGKDATESAVWSEAPNAEIVHIAAHGEYDPNNPLFSKLYLAKDDQKDGRLEVHDIYELDLREFTNLVVLSACETNLGELSQGDEVIGLNRALIYAGTPTVIASLWRVDDEATSVLMQQFYTHLQEGMGKAEALRQAQIDVRKDFPHPYFWAAFVLMGDGGKL